MEKNKIKKMDLSVLLEKLPGSVYCKDINGVYLNCNEYMAHMAGVASSEEVIGKTDYDMPWRDQADALRVIDQAIMSSGEPKTLEETGKLANGTWATYLTTKNPLFNEEGKVIGLYGLSVDITKHKQFENKLLTENKIAKNYSRFTNIDQIINAMPGYVYWKDTEGVYQGCNKTLLAALGFSSVDQVIGKTDYDLVKMCGLNIDAVEVFRKVDNEVIQSGIPTINHEELPFNFIGTQIVQQLTNKVPLRDENGQITGVLGISIDIADRNKREAGFLEQVFACMPGSVYWKNKDGVYQNCNDELEKLVGVNKAEIIGKTDWDIGKRLGWSKEIIKKIIEIDQSVMRTGNARLNYEELPFHFLDGETIIQLSNKVPLRDEKSQVIGVLGISIDITNRKKMEEELKIAKEQAEIVNHAKTEFIANMSHDVKTPLSGMIALSELLSTRIQNEYQELAQDISQAGQQLMVFFENCIELSKLETGSIVLPEETFNLKHLLNEIFHLFQPTIKSKNLTLHLAYSDKIPKRLLGSRTTIHRILLNLLSNAVKFTAQGSIKITAKLSKRSTDEKKILQLMIADTGIGIPKDKQKIIFERFSRLIPSYQGTYEGHGIGLYLVQKFIKKIGGQISLQSQEGKGSRFIVAIPLRVPLLADDEYDDEAIDFYPEALAYPNIKSLIPEIKNSPVVTQEVKPPVIKNINKVKVLLVEDNVIAQKSSIILLESLGCEVDLAQCGQKAISLFKPGHYTLVFMDIGLPDIKGYKVAERLREIEKGTSFHVPILGLSAHTTKEEKELSNVAGMNEMISKPLLTDNAQKVLERYVLGFVEASLFRTEDNLRIIDLPKTARDSSETEQQSWEMLEMLMTILPKSRAEIAAAYQAKNIDLLLKRVHKLHGDVCYVSTPHLLQAVKTLESNLKNGDEQQLDMLYQQLLIAIEVFEKTYQLFK